MDNRIVSISMPERLYRILDYRVKAGLYGSVSEYVRDLVRKDLIPEIKAAEAREARRRETLESPLQTRG